MTLGYHFVPILPIDPEADDCVDRLVQENKEWQTLKRDLNEGRERKLFMEEGKNMLTTDKIAPNNKTKVEDNSFTVETLKQDAARLGLSDVVKAIEQQEAKQDKNLAVSPTVLGFIQRMQGLVGDTEKLLGMFTRLIESTKTKMPGLPGVSEKDVEIAWVIGVKENLRDVRNDLAYGMGLALALKETKK